MNVNIREEIAKRISNTIKVPDYMVMNGKNKEEAKSYWVQIRNIRTGYTKVVSRMKAFRYINNRPASWSITNPMVTLKDKWELVK